VVALPKHPPIECHDSSDPRIPTTRFPCFGDLSRIHFKYRTQSLCGMHSVEQLVHVLLKRSAHAILEGTEKNTPIHQYVIVHAKGLC
jgi:hypothetical protein